MFSFSSATGSMITGNLDQNKNKNLRILVIVPSGFCFGLQNLTLAFFAELRGRVTAHFLNTRWSDGEFQQRVEALGFPQSKTWLGMFSRKLDWLNLKMTLECLFKLPIAWRDFIRLYRNFQPNVIYLASHHEIIQLWPLLFFLRNKVVCHMHDPPPAIPFQKLSFFFWRRAVNRFLFISESTRDRFSRLGAIGKQDKTIHNGVKVSPLAFPRQRSNRFCKQFGWSEQSIIIGLTGQMSQHKGHEDFLAAARLLKTNEQLRFVIAGKQQEPFFSHLKCLVKDYCLEQHVGFVGWLPQSCEFFEGIDIFVLASRHEEGFGLVIAEASERGLPVICTHSGGAVEIVRDGETGIVVEKNKPEQIATAIKRLANNKSLRFHMGQAGRKRVCQAFNLENQVNYFEKTLDELIISEG
jgi:glycosyltransferase involved in cell wall biosynthesis